MTQSGENVMTFANEFTMTIAGKAVRTAEQMSVVNPATSEVFAECPRAGEKELNEAVAAAKEAFPDWRARSVDERKQLLTQFGEALMTNARDLATLFSQENGRPVDLAAQEIMGGAQWMMATAQIDLPVELVEDSDNRRVEVHHEPLGVVGGIVPWNFPVLLACWKIGPAVVTGNTIVVKPSPYTPLCTLRLGEMAREIFPEGVVNVICGGDELGPMMTTHPDIAKISFTGSTATGKKVMESASRDLKRITLELGGNDAAIVLPDVSVDKVAEQIFNGAFINSAQVCVATKRLYVHDDIYDALRERLHQLLKDAVVGNGAEQGVQFGPIQNDMQHRKVLDLMDDARKNGLTLLQGRDVPDKGYFVPLTIIDNPPEDSRVVTEEAFGPVLPMMRFCDEEDVIRRANDTCYGLAGSVWSANVEAAVNIASRLNTGTVWINSNLESSPFIPLSGAKQSGFGVENGVDGLKEFTQTKSVYIPKQADVA